jgi:NAD(P)-dependent dehydrogenase (short-subunit alcohol dehydrogenase family)
MPGQLAVLVTGASSGIGRATALEFARRGHRVFAAARTGSALAELSAGSPAITAVTMDVTDPASVRAGWAKIEAETGSAGVDVLVNNAGFALTGPLEVLTDEDIQRQFATNVFGLLSLTRIVLPGMRARRSGRIINISSVLGRFAMPGVGAYAATKYAVEALSDAMRQEVAGFGIKVVIMEPGFVATNIAGASDAHASSGTSVPDAYAPLVAASEKYMSDQLAKAVPAETIATAIAKAAEDRDPRTRYVVPARTRALITLLTSLPDRLYDRAMRRTLGLGKVEVARS